MAGSFPKREGKRKGGKMITEETGKKKERKRKRGKERKKNTKKKDIKWFLPRYYFSFLPKLLGRLLETAEPLP